MSFLKTENKSSRARPSADAAEVEKKPSRVEHLASLVNLFQVMDSSVPEIIHFALDQGIELTCSDTAALFVFKSGEERVEHYQGLGRESFPEMDPDLLKSLLAGGAPRILNQDQEWPQVEKFRMHSSASEGNFIFTPICGFEDFEAIAGLFRKGPLYNDSEAAYFALLMDSMMRLVHNKNTAEALTAALEESRRRRDEMSALFEAGRSLLGNWEFRSSVEKILDTCRRIIQAEHGFVVLTSNDEHSLLPTVVLGSPVPESGVQDLLDFSLEVRGGAEPVFSRRSEPTAHGDEDRLGPALRRMGFDSYLAAPVILDDSHFGSVCLFNGAEGFDQNDAELIKNFCSLFAMARQEEITRKALAKSEDKAEKFFGESKRMHEIYESLLQATPDGIVIYDFNLGLTYVNPAFEKTLGYSLEELKGVPLKPVLDFDSPLSSADWLSSQYGESRSNLETRGKAKDGRVLDISLSVSGFVNPSGDGRSIVFIIRDLTESKMLRNQLYQAQKQEALGVLAGGIAHDFNNILSAIMGYTELTLYNFSKEDSAYKHLTQVLKAGKRAADLVQQILTYSRRSDDELRPTPVKPIVKETIKLLRATLPSTMEIIEKYQFEDDFVLGSSTQIHQVIMNLCANARQAMKRGGTLTIIMDNQEVAAGELIVANPTLKPGRYLKLIVQDTGPGIPAELQERIFEPYFTTKTVGEGSGLGLATVQGIVEMHRGAITVESRVGTGTVFSVYLPLSEVKPIFYRSNFTSGFFSMISRGACYVLWCLVPRLGFFGLTDLRI